MFSGSIYQHGKTRTPITLLMGKQNGTAVLQNSLTVSYSVKNIEPCNTRMDLKRCPKWKDTQ